MNNIQIISDNNIKSHRIKNKLIKKIKNNFIKKK